MKAIKITETKNFMGILLRSDCFDDFLLADASITTYNTFTIDGRMIPEFYQNDVNLPDEQPAYDFSCWKDLQNLCFEQIKGKRTPIRFHFVLYLKPEKAAALFHTAISTTDTMLLPRQETASNSSIPDAFSHFVLNIKYQNGVLTLITAVSYHTFTIDKSADLLWDQYMLRFLTAQNIAFEAEDSSSIL